MIKPLTITVPTLLVIAVSSMIATTVQADLLVKEVAVAAATMSQMDTPEQGFAALDSIASDDLADLTGRDNLTNVQSIQELDATVSNSSFNADTIMSGAITIEQHALDNFEGVGVFNIFTGNNNAVDAAVGISVYITE